MDAIKEQADKLGRALPQAGVGPAGMMDLVVGLDSSTTATKAVAWTR